MKKILVFVLAVICLLSCTSCSNGKSDNNNVSSDTSYVEPQNTSVQVVGDDIVKTQNLSDIYFEYTFHFVDDSLNSITLKVTTDSDDLRNSVISSMESIGFINPTVDGENLVMYSSDDLIHQYDSIASTQNEFYDLLNN